MKSKRPSSKERKSARKARPARPRALARVAPTAPAPPAAPAPLPVPERDPTAAPLFRLHASDTLEAAYQAWEQLRAERTGARERLAEERRRLEEEAAFWVGAVRAASGVRVAPPSPAEAEAAALAPAPPLQGALSGAEERLAAAREELDRRAARMEAAFEAAEAQVKGQLRARAARYAAMRPRVVLVRHPAGRTRAILHLERVSPDVSVVLMFLLTGKLPTRYDFLFDDSTDDVSLPPNALYPDEGVSPADTRPGAAALAERLRAAADLVPVKGFIPLFTTTVAGVQRLHRLRERGPVMEVEVAEGDELRSALLLEEAEAVAGALLRLKLEGRIDLELKAG